MRQSTARRPHPKAKFTKEEDVLLRKLVFQFGEDVWPQVAQHMRNRNSRQCKERWNNYLSPNISTEPWTPDEDSLLQQKIRELGQKWVQIATFFPARTDVNVKNRFNLLSRRSKRTARAPRPPAPEVPMPALLTAQLSPVVQPSGGPRTPFPPLSAPEFGAFPLFRADK
jgi:hypothetical protein